jgi:hypothetical protein
VKPTPEDLMAHTPSHGAGLLVDNFVKNFFWALVFEFWGIQLSTEIDPAKIKICNEINRLRESLGMCFEKFTPSTQLAVLVEYSAASRMVLRIERLSNPQSGSCPCLNLSI